MGQNLLNVEIHREFVHKTANGKQLLLHGDEFDEAVRCSRINHLLGDISYGLLLFINRWGNRFLKPYPVTPAALTG